MFLKVLVASSQLWQPHILLIDHVKTYLTIMVDSSKITVEHALTANVNKCILKFAIYITTDSNLNIMDQTWHIYGYWNGSVETKLYSSANVIGMYSYVIMTFLGVII